ncbi:restriction endonuclease subunit S [Enterococcus faecalis]|nr:restriction endonuclease subunit S [Enterococcus faecalis]
MREEMKKVPRIRFRGFQEDWEQRKLEDISDKVTEKNKNNEFTETLTNSAEFGIINQREFFDKDISNEKNLNGYYIVREDDFVYNPRISNYAPVGPIKRNKLGRTGVMSPLYYVFRPHDIDKKFLEYFFGTTIWHKFMKLNGDSGARADRFAIKDSVFKTMPIPYPSIEEQKKVGKFFDDLNDTIALHQRKLDQLKELKKAYLQLMFPVKDERVPKLRFADFEEEWEQCKLEDLANKYNNLRIPITASKRIYGNTPYYGANGIQDFVEGYTHDGEFILVAEDGASNLKDYPVQYVNGKVWVNNHAHVLQAKRSKADNKFLMNAIKSINIEPFLVGGGRSKLNSEVMMNLEINTPSKDEQLKISTLCKQLDDITALYQNKLNQLKNLKKSYLQNMFI